MFDRQLLDWLKPVTEPTARRLLALGLSADQMTLTGFAIGLMAALLIATGFTLWAILPLLVSRAFDGLDGAMARLSHTTDRGAYLDISLDFIFYASIPAAFVILAPASNAVAGVLLLVAFMGTGASFLAYAAIAEKRRLTSAAHPAKSFYYIDGLTEGAETIACFVAMCLWPRYFAAIAFVYAALCLATTVTRLIAGWRDFGATKN